MKIINGGGNETDDETMKLLETSSLKTKHFDLDGKKLIGRLCKIFDFI